ncbi:MAG: YhfC family glutamic-type intramembrane protease [Anaerolineales bacterium]
MNPNTIAAFIVSLLLQVGCPLVAVLYYRHRTHARWELFAYGAIIFAVFQLFTWLPLNAYLNVVVGDTLESDLWAFMWLLATALGTALAEEGGRWLGYRYLFPRGSFRLTWRNGVMYGLGQAFVETALFIAGLTFMTFMAYIFLGRLDPQLVSRSSSPETSAAFQETLETIRNTAWRQPLTIAVERLLSLPHQVAWALLVMQSLVFSERRWFLFAVLYHASIGIIVPGLARLSGFFIAEAVNVLLALASLWIIIRLRALSKGTGGV